MDERGMTMARGMVVLIVMLCALLGLFVAVYFGVGESEQRPLFEMNQHSDYTAYELVNHANENIEDGKFSVEGGVVMSDTGDTLEPGEELVIVPTDDEVTVVWEGEDGTEQTRVIEEEEIDEMMFDIVTDDDVDIGEEEEVAGVFSESGEVDIDSGAEVTGSVVSGDDEVVIAEGVLVEGFVVGEGDIVIEDGATVEQDVVSKHGDVVLGEDVRIGGDVEAAGEVRLSAGAVVDGEIDAAETVVEE